MSRWPKRSTVAATAAAACSGSRTSATVAAAWWPSAVSFAAASSAVVGLMSAIITAPPACTTSDAVSNPMPWAPPVTSRVLPLMSIATVISGSLQLGLTGGGLALARSLELLHPLDRGGAEDEVLGRRRFGSQARRATVDDVRDDAGLDRRARIGRRSQDRGQQL